MYKVINLRDATPLAKYKFRMMLFEVRYLIEKNHKSKSHKQEFLMCVLHDFEFNFLEDGGFYTWNFMVKDFHDYKKEDYLNTLLDFSKSPNIVYECLCKLYDTISKSSSIPVECLSDHSMNYLGWFVDLLEDLCIELKDHVSGLFFVGTSPTCTVYTF